MYHSLGLFIENQIINLYIIGIYCFTGVEVNQEQEFVVDTKGAGGQGHLEVTMVIYLFIYFFHGITQRKTVSPHAFVCFSS